MKWWCSLLYLQFLSSYLASWQLNNSWVELDVPVIIISSFITAGSFSIDSVFFPLIVKVEGVTSPFQVVLLFGGSDHSLLKQRRDLFIHLVHRGDVKADGNGGRVPAWLDSRDFVLGGRWNCTVKARFVGDQSQEKVIIQSPLHCAINIYFIVICYSMKRAISITFCW